MHRSLLLLLSFCAGLACAVGGSSEAPASEPHAEGTRSVAVEPAAEPESTAVTGQPLVVERVVRLELSSRANGVHYVLDVALPRSYAQESDRRYPVVYLLDSHYSLLIARNVVDHLSERGDLPEVLLVGIGYEGPTDRAAAEYRVNRTRDYTPTYVADGGYGKEAQAVSGGGPRFLQFLEGELIPLVDQRYRTVVGERCLVGHSYGGLFVSWTLLQRPELFSCAVAVSPSLWYDDRRMFALEAELARAHGDLPVRAYFAVGSREGDGRRDMVGDLRELTSRLDGRGYPGLELRAEVLDGETHNSVFPRALSNGLRYVLGGR